MRESALAPASSVRPATPSLAVFLAAAAVTVCLAAPAGAQQELPTVYEEDRFYVTPVTEAGDTLVLFTDTGGGLFLLDAAVERLGLAVLGPEELEERFGLELPEEVVREMVGGFAELPAFRAGATIPPPRTPWGEAPVLPVLAGRDAPDAAFLAVLGDGMLGQTWFAGRVWTFDYPNRKLLLHGAEVALPDAEAAIPDAEAAAPDGPAHLEGTRLELGFQTDEEGTRRTNYPRMQIEVDGETLDMLFDTGATTILTDEAVEAIGDGRAAARATSFITRSVFERWRERNPDWRVIEDAERGSGEAMIEARDVVIAGHSIDSVWFTRRLDRNFHEWMSQWMDRRIEGAVGGNALRHYRVTVDYPNAFAVFERP